MVSFTNILFVAGTAAALAIQERDVTTVLNNLKAIDTATKKLTTDTTSWTGGASGAITIQNDESAVDKAVNSATSEAKTEPQANSADSKTIITYVTGTFTPDIKAALNAVVAKKTQFAAVGLSSTVLSDLKQLKTDSDALGAALKAVASSDQKTPAQNAINSIDTLFNSAIAVFS